MQNTTKEEEVQDDQEKVRDDKEEDRRGSPYTREQYQKQFTLWHGASRRCSKCGEVMSERETHVHICKR